MIARLVPGLAVVVGGGFLLMNYGIYGWTLFVALPVLVGACGAIRAQSRVSATVRGLAAGALASLSLLVLGMEGLICVFMAFPLTAPLGALGGWLAYTLGRSPEGKRSAAALLLVPAGTLGWDVTAKPPLFEVTTSIGIAAPPARVWRHVVTFAELPAPGEWFFKAGIAYPVRARIEGSGPGAIRYCEFSTGAFVEPIETWQEPSLLKFRVTENPAPMHEWSPYANVLPKHLHGYMVSKQGQFRLTPLPGGRTLLEGTTWYQHGLWPAGYWRLWSDAMIHRIHLRVLTHIRTLAERSQQIAD